MQLSFTYVGFVLAAFTAAVPQNIGFNPPEPTIPCKVFAVLLATWLLSGLHVDTMSDDF